MRTLRQLAEEAAEELPVATGGDGGPPLHPGAKGSGNPLLDEADAGETIEDPVDNDVVDGKVDELCRAIAVCMEDDHGYAGWLGSPAYKALVDGVRDAIFKYATPHRDA